MLTWTAPSSPSILKRLPPYSGIRLSTSSTRAPSAARRCASVEPMKPSPPVIKMRFSRKTPPKAASASFAISAHCPIRQFAAGKTVAPAILSPVQFAAGKTGGATRLEFGHDAGGGQDGKEITEGDVSLAGGRVVAVVAVEAVVGAVQEIHHLCVDREFPVLEGSGLVDAD